MVGLPRISLYVVFAGEEGHQTQANVNHDREDGFEGFRRQEYRLKLFLFSHLVLLLDVDIFDGVW